MSGSNFVWLVVNSASGSYSESALAELCEAIGSGRSALKKTIDCQTDQLPNRRELEAENVEQLIVFAGDGTLSTYLRRLEHEAWQGAVLPLPGGTQNLFCKSMFGDRSAPTIAGMLAQDKLTQTHRNCLRCGEFTALCEILMGPGARWADVREDLRDGEVGQLLNKSLDITADSATGPLVRMVEPDVGRQTGYPGLHFSIPESSMVARGYHMDNLTEWLKQGLAIVKRDFRDGPYDDLGTIAQARCLSTDGTDIDLMVDGERESAKSGVKIESALFELTLLGLPD